MYFFFVFFFKQKTAYEMRISDWSSDVCSSDLDVHRQDVADPGGALVLEELAGAGTPQRIGLARGDFGGRHRHADRATATPLRRVVELGHLWRLAEIGAAAEVAGAEHQGEAGQGCQAERRSDGHTSELQSLMRTSAAVFSLNKKTQRA